MRTGEGGAEGRLLVVAAQGPLNLATVFPDGMVWQPDQQVPVWGWAPEERSPE